LKTDLNGYNLSSLAYGQSVYKMSVTYGYDNRELGLYSVGLTARYTDLTYTEVKEILDYGLVAPQRFVVSNVRMAYNEKTGYLSGDISFSTFFIPGQTTPYEFPQEVVDGLGSGRRFDDLFGARKNH
jgi:hypothetical protein